MTDIRILPASLDDLPALTKMEETVFEMDRISRRSFRRWLTHPQSSALLVAKAETTLAGYILILLHQGTRLARLYSIAVSDDFRGQKIGQRLLEAGEEIARTAGRVYLRLEVRQDNTSAIHLYEKLGFQRFGEYENYYEDHADAIRYQKRILNFDASHWERPVPWYRQTTRFTCGPAALMMALKALDSQYRMSRSEELTLWREATTIFMTRGHGGCHPLGLAMAAKDRGFDADVWISKKEPLFVDGVRTHDKKEIVELVHNDFVRSAKQAGIAIHFREVTQQLLTRELEAGGVPLVMISTWQMDGKHTPHWVVLSAFDEDFLYLHDPDPSGLQTELDCQYLPVARDDFAQMARFGKQRLRTAVIIRPRHNAETSSGKD
jgi:ribosomal-protein-alanine acetyltransferase